jgi:hypothetical protein
VSSIQLFIIFVLFFMQNAHAAAGGHIDDESTAAIEEQIKQQLAGAPLKGKDIEMSGSNLLPAGNFTRRDSKIAGASPEKVITDLPLRRISNEAILTLLQWAGQICRAAHIVAYWRHLLSGWFKESNLFCRFFCLRVFLFKGPPIGPSYKFSKAPYWLQFFSLPFLNIIKVISGVLQPSAGSLYVVFYIQSQIFWHLASSHMRVSFEQYVFLQVPSNGK